MSRCFICNYCELGLSDIPVDNRIIVDDICSVCISIIKDEKEIKTIGDAIDDESDDLSDGSTWELSGNARGNSSNRKDTGAILRNSKGSQKQESDWSLRGVEHDYVSHEG